MHPPVFPTNSSITRHGPSLSPALLGTGFAVLFSTMTVLRLPAVVPLRFVAFAAPVPPAPSICSYLLPVPRWVGCSQARMISGSSLRHPFLPMEQRGSPRFLGSPFVPLPCSRTPAAPACHAISGSSVLPPLIRRRRPQQCSISRLDSHGFSTRCLRFQLRLSLHWQDSLPVGGKPLPDGFRTHWTPMANFKCGFTYRLFQRPRLILAPLTSDL